MIEKNRYTHAMKYTILIIVTLLLSACGSVDTTPIPESLKTEKTILALGDSLTAGYGLSVSDSYPSQLEAKLREK
jgi:lysophospholipase L1-like esterase